MLNYQRVPQMDGHRKPQRNLHSDIPRFFVHLRSGPRHGLAVLRGPGRGKDFVTGGHPGGLGQHTEGEN